MPLIRMIQPEAQSTLRSKATRLDYRSSARIKAEYIQADTAINPDVARFN